MRPRTAIAIAAALVFVISSWVPFGREALYPLTLFTTWVHELGHGLTALALGGHFHALDIFRDASGLAHCTVDPGWRDGVVALGGLLAPPIVGAAVLALVHGPRRARVVLAIFAAALVASVAIYVRTATGIIAMPLVAGLLGWAAWRGFAGRPGRRVILVQVLGVVLALDTLTRMIGYVFERSVVIDGKKLPTDIANVASALGGSYVLWGCAVTAVAVGLLALAAWWAWGRPARPFQPARAAGPAR